jgi:hypothetical protein
MRIYVNMSVAALAILIVAGCKTPISGEEACTMIGQLPEVGAASRDIKDDTQEDVVVRAVLAGNKPVKIDGRTYWRIWLSGEYQTHCVVLGSFLVATDTGEITVKHPPSREPIGFDQLLD